MEGSYCSNVSSVFEIDRLVGKLKFLIIDCEVQLALLRIEFYGDCIARAETFAELRSFLVGAISNIPRAK